MPEMTEELPEKSVKRIEEPAISLKKIAQLEADLEEMKKDKEVQMSRWTAKIAQIEANLKIAKLEADLVDGRERNRELERKIAETKRKNDDLEAQLKTQNMEVRNGKAKIGELEEKINALQNKNSGLEAQIQLEGIKTVEMAKLQADLNRTMTFLDLSRDGWSLLEKTGSWYKVIDQEMTFDEAEAYCASRKSHLVSIHSQVERNQKETIFISVKTHEWNSHFWIGLKRNPKKGDAFEWTDRSPVQFTNWEVAVSLFGSNIRTDSKTHAFLSSHKGTWYSNSPTYQSRFICQRSSQF